MGVSEGRSGLGAGAEARGLLPTGHHPQGDHTVTELVAGPNLDSFPALMLRVVAAGVATAGVTGIGSVALLFVRAPAWLSLIFEPVSLLLLPGMMISMKHAGPHDLDPILILKSSVAFYFTFFLAWFELRAWRARRRAQPSPR